MDSKFAPFERADIAYSKVGDHALVASVLRPKLKVQARSPVLVFWHGGGFVIGHRLYEPWWSDWSGLNIPSPPSVDRCLNFCRLIEYALSKEAIIVAADYRLAPEANGTDILNDMEAFWSWLATTLPSIAHAQAWQAQPDLTRILCVGQSTGGCLAVQSALLHPELDIKAIVSLYAPLEYDVPTFTVPHPRRILGTMPPAPRQAEAIIRSYAKKNKGHVRTAGDPAHMWELLLCVMQQGRVPTFMNAWSDPRIDIISLLKEVKRIPPIWLIHGEDDTVVRFLVPLSLQF